MWDAKIWFFLLEGYIYWKQECTCLPCNLQIRLVVVHRGCIWSRRHAPCTCAFMWPTDAIKQTAKIEPILIFVVFVVAYYFLYCWILGGELQEPLVLSIQMFRKIKLPETIWYHNFYFFSMLMSSSHVSYFIFLQKINCMIRCKMKLRRTNLSFATTIFDNKTLGGFINYKLNALIYFII